PDVVSLIFSQYNKLQPLYAYSISRQPCLMAYAAAGKRVLITGASSGLGAALARQLAGREAVVGLIARRRARLDEVLADCRRSAPESAMWVADLADTSALRDLALRAWD